MGTGEGNGAENGAENGIGKKRMANLELLRCVAMMMVVVLHFLGKGKVLPDLTGESIGVAGVAAWGLEALCIVAVNVYMFISGYFLCTSSFKLSRLIQLYLQVWVYSVAFGLLGALTGVLAETPFDTHYLLTLVFPVTMGHYWFITAYVFLYVLLPFVGMAAKQMTKKQMQAAVGLLLLVFCVAKSVLPVRLEMDGQGYDCLWYLCVFMSAAYVRRFGVKILEKKWSSLLLYLGCCSLIMAGTFGLRAIYLRTGSLGMMIKMCLEYNHVLPFLAAVGLFGFFRGIQVKGKIASAINFMAPYTLGVYLLHENLGLRYSWQKWLGAGRIDSVGSLFLWTLAAVITVFFCGILVDMARKWIFELLNRILSNLLIYRKLTGWIGKIDEAFRVGLGQEV